MGVLCMLLVGWSTVSIEQVQTSGTEIAKVTIDGDATSIYAPTSGGSTISINPIQTEGVEIAQFTIDGESTSVYAPSSGEGKIDFDVKEHVVPEIAPWDYTLTDINYIGTFATDTGIKLYTTENIQKDFTMQMQISNVKNPTGNWGGILGSEMMHLCTKESGSYRSELFGETEWSTVTDFLTSSGSYWAGPFDIKITRRNGIVTMTCTYPDGTTSQNSAKHYLTTFEDDYVCIGAYAGTSAPYATFYLNSFQFRWDDAISYDIVQLKDNKSTSLMPTTTSDSVLFSDNRTLTEHAQDWGHGGGSTVSVEQIQSTGTEIAKLSIDGTITSLYAPQGGGGEFDYPNAISTTEISDFATEGKTVLAAINELNSKISSIVDGNEVEW